MASHKFWHFLTLPVDSKISMNSTVVAALASASQASPTIAGSATMAAAAAAAAPAAPPTAAAAPTPVEVAVEPPEGEGTEEESSSCPRSASGPTGSTDHELCGKHGLLL